MKKRLTEVQAPIPKKDNNQNKRHSLSGGIVIPSVKKYEDVSLVSDSLSINSGVTSNIEHSIPYSNANTLRSHTNSKTNLHKAIQLAPGGRVTINLASERNNHHPTQHYSPRSITNNTNRVNIISSLIPDPIPIPTEIIPVHRSSGELSVSVVDDPDGGIYKKYNYTTRRESLWNNQPQDSMEYLDQERKKFVEAKLAEQKLQEEKQLELEKQKESYETILKLKVLNTLFDKNIAFHGDNTHETQQTHDETTVSNSDNQVEGGGETSGDISSQVPSSAEQAARKLLAAVIASKVPKFRSKDFRQQRVQEQTPLNSDESKQVVDELQSSIEELAMSKAREKLKTLANFIGGHTSRKLFGFWNMIETRFKSSPYFKTVLTLDANGLSHPVKHPAMFVSSLISLVCSSRVKVSHQELSVYLLRFGMTTEQILLARQIAAINSVVALCNEIKYYRLDYYKDMMNEYMKKEEIMISIKELMDFIFSNDIKEREYELDVIKNNRQQEVEIMLLEKRQKDEIKDRQMKRKQKLIDDFENILDEIQLLKDPVTDDLILDFIDTIQYCDNFIQEYYEDQVSHIPQDVVAFIGFEAYPKDIQDKINQRMNRSKSRKELRKSQSATPAGLTRGSSLASLGSLGSLDSNEVIGEMAIELSSPSNKSPKKLPIQEYLLTISITKVKLAGPPHALTTMRNMVALSKTFPKFSYRGMVETIQFIAAVKLQATIRGFCRHYPYFEARRRWRYKFAIIKDKFFHSWEKDVKYIISLRRYCKRKLIVWRRYIKQVKYRQYVFRTCFWMFYTWKKVATENAIAKEKTKFLVGRVWPTFLQLTIFRAWKKHSMIKSSLHKRITWFQQKRYHALSQLFVQFWFYFGKKQKFLRKIWVRKGAHMLKRHNLRIEKTYFLLWHVYIWMKKYVRNHVQVNPTLLLNYKQHLFHYQQSTQNTARTNVSTNSSTASPTSTTLQSRLNEPGGSSNNLLSMANSNNPNNSSLTIRKPWKKLSFSERRILCSLKRFDNMMKIADQSVVKSAISAQGAKSSRKSIVGAHSRRISTDNNPSAASGGNNQQLREVRRKQLEKKLEFIKLETKLKMDNHNMFYLYKYIPPPPSKKQSTEILTIPSSLATTVNPLDNIDNLEFIPKMNIYEKKSTRQFNHVRNHEALYAQENDIDSDGEDKEIPTMLTSVYERAGIRLFPSTEHILEYISKKENRHSSFFSIIGGNNSSSNSSSSLSSEKSKYKLVGVNESLMVDRINSLKKGYVFRNQWAYFENTMRYHHFMYLAFKNLRLNAFYRNKYRRYLKIRHLNKIRIIFIAWKDFTQKFNVLKANGTIEDWFAMTDDIEGNINDSTLSDRLYHLMRTQHTAKLSRLRQIGKKVKEMEELFQKELEQQRNPPPPKTNFMVPPPINVNTTTTTNNNNNNGSLTRNVNTPKGKLRKATSKVKNMRTLTYSVLNRAESLESRPGSPMAMSTKPSTPKTPTDNKHEIVLKRQKSKTLIDNKNNKKDGKESIKDSKDEDDNNDDEDDDEDEDDSKSRDLVGLFVHAVVPTGIPKEVSDSPEPPPQPQELPKSPKHNRHNSFDDDNQTNARTRKIKELNLIDMNDEDDENFYRQQELRYEEQMKRIQLQQKQYTQFRAKYPLPNLFHYDQEDRIIETNVVEKFKIFAKLIKTRLLDFVVRANDESAAREQHNELIKSMVKEVFDMENKITEEAIAKQSEYISSYRIHIANHLINVLYKIREEVQISMIKAELKIYFRAMRLPMLIKRSYHLLNYKKLINWIRICKRLQSIDRNIHHYYRKKILWIRFMNWLKYIEIEKLNTSNSFRSMLRRKVKILPDFHHQLSNRGFNQSIYYKKLNEPIQPHPGGLQQSLANTGKKLPFAIPNIITNMDENGKIVLSSTEKIEATIPPITPSHASPAPPKTDYQYYNNEELHNSMNDFKMIYARWKMYTQEKILFRIMSEKVTKLYRLKLIHQIFYILKHPIKDRKDYLQFMKKEPSCYPMIQLQSDLEQLSKHFIPCRKKSLPHFIKKQNRKIKFQLVQSGKQTLTFKKFIHEFHYQTNQRISAEQRILFESFELRGYQDFVDIPTPTVRSDPIMPPIMSKLDGKEFQDPVFQDVALNGTESAVPGGYRLSKLKFAMQLNGGAASMQASGNGFLGSVIFGWQCIWSADGSRDVESAPRGLWHAAGVSVQEIIIPKDDYVTGLEYLYDGPFMTGVRVKLMIGGWTKWVGGKSSLSALSVVMDTGLCPEQPFERERHLDPEEIEHPALPYIYVIGFFGIIHQQKATGMGLIVRKIKTQNIFSYYWVQDALQQRMKVRVASEKVAVPNASDNVSINANSIPSETNFVSGAAAQMLQEDSLTVSVTTDHSEDIQPKDQQDKEGEEDDDDNHSDYSEFEEAKGLLAAQEPADATVRLNADLGLSLTQEADEVVNTQGLGGDDMDEVALALHADEDESSAQIRIERMRIERAKARAAKRFAMWSQGEGLINEPLSSAETQFFDVLRMRMTELTTAKVRAEEFARRLWTNKDLRTHPDFSKLLGLGIVSQLSTWLFNTWSKKLAKFCVTEKKGINAIKQAKALTIRANKLVKKAGRVFAETYTLEHTSQPWMGKALLGPYERAMKKEYYQKIQELKDEHFRILQNSQDLRLQAVDIARQGKAFLPRMSLNAFVYANFRVKIAAARHKENLLERMSLDQIKNGLFGSNMKEELLNKDQMNAIHASLKERKIVLKDHSTLQRLLDDVLAEEELIVEIEKQQKLADSLRSPRRRILTSNLPSLPPSSRSSPMATPKHGLHGFSDSNPNSTQNSRSSTPDQKNIHQRKKGLTQDLRKKAMLTSTSSSTSSLTNPFHKAFDTTTINENTMLSLPPLPHSSNNNHQNHIKTKGKTLIMSTTQSTSQLPTTNTNHNTNHMTSLSRSHSQNSNSFHD